MQSFRILNSEHVSITQEADTIIGRAKVGASCVVTLGSLIFFSTETGDAWMLDPQDDFALCLAQSGERQPFSITETVNNFRIEWPSTYQISGDLFIVTERNGKIRRILGYPTATISHAKG